MDGEQASVHTEEKTNKHIFFRIKKEPVDYVDVYVEEETLHSGPGDHWNADAGLYPVFEDENNSREEHCDADIDGWVNDGNAAPRSDEESNMEDAMELEGEINSSHQNFEGKTGKAVQSKFSNAGVKKQSPETNLLALDPGGINTGKETLQCSVCQMSFLNKTHVTKHKESPSVKKPYECTHCKEAFSSTLHLIDHCRMHTHESACECSECFNPTSNLRKHTSGHLQRSEENLYGCTYCNQVFSSPTSLSAHVSRHVGKKYFFRCSRCQKGFRSECNLWSHMKTHSEENPFGSSKASSHTTSVKAKVRNCSRPKASSHTTSKNANVRSRSNRKASDAKKRRTDKNFECATCGKDVDYKCMCYLRLEMNTQTGKKPLYACIYCTKEFVRLRLLNEHARSHTGAKPYQCSECFQSFVSNCNLKRHMRTHVGEKPHECEYCNKTFSRKGHLTDHLRIHTGERPFPCSVCDKWFVTKSNLANHARNHTGEKPCECVYCDRTFKTATALNQHILTHEGKKPFLCLHCGKGFSQKQKLKKHCRKHTAKGSFQCTKCNKSFTSNSKRLKHFKLLHDGKSH